MHTSQRLMERVLSEVEGTSHRNKPAFLKRPSIETTPFAIESSVFFATFCNNLSVTGVADPGYRNSHGDFSNL
jgi:hypothetical protein